MKLEDHKIERMPAAPSFRNLLGPSFILLGLGLGSGELILWPYLASNFGLGIIWGAVLGITLQFFMNMEIERYALVRGESIFVGFARAFKLAPFWFIISTFAGFGWPGIVGSSAYLFGNLIGISQTHIIAIGMLILIGLILTLGPILYKTVEKFTMMLILIAVPVIFALVLFLAKGADWSALGKGIVGIGEDYRFLPAGIPLASFLAAFAFSGAGGNLNLAQSFYVKEKGYGMGKFSGRITSLLTGKLEEIRLEGTKFEMDKKNLFRFKQWWKLINFEHALVFLVGGAFTIVMLALLAYVTAFGKTTPAAGIEFVLYEAQTIAQKTLPILGTVFLLVGSVMLFSTQMTVMDATSRIMAENLLIIKRKVWKTNKLPKIYYSFLWAQIVFGIIVFLGKFREPLFLLTLGAVINAGAMFIHIGLTLFVNMKLERQLRPNMARILAMVFAFILFGFFTLKALIG